MQGAGWPPGESGEKLLGWGGGRGSRDGKTESRCSESRGSHARHGPVEYNRSHNTMPNHVVP